MEQCMEQCMEQHRKGTEMSNILGVLLTILEIVFGFPKNNRSIARKYLNPAFIGAKLFEIVRNA